MKVNPIKKIADPMFTRVEKLNNNPEIKNLYLFLVLIKFK
tara:strand:+ start:420 stop:539 length:120 start_codon:yes stop_codon:yes gene_type:complete